MSCCKYHFSHNRNINSDLALEYRATVFVMRDEDEKGDPETT